MQNLLASVSGFNPKIWFEGNETIGQPLVFFFVVVVWTECIRIRASLTWQQLEIDALRIVLNQQIDVFVAFLREVTVLLDAVHAHRTYHDVGHVCHIAESKPKQTHTAAVPIRTRGAGFVEMEEGDKEGDTIAGHGDQGLISQSFVWSRVTKQTQTDVCVMCAASAESQRRFCAADCCCCSSALKQRVQNAL